MDREKVLLGHLNSMGDCLLATVIARQIKEVDYPGCHLTWAINEKSKQVAALNPYIDELWEIPTGKSQTMPDEWDAFAAEAVKRKQNGDFDVVLLTQVMGENWLNYDGGIRSSIYNNYPHPITVPHQPIIQLSAEEVENVRRFAEENRLDQYKQVILVECAPNSFSTALNPQSAYNLAVDITSENKEVAFILSSNKKIDSQHPSVIDASKLTFRENAELTKYCSLFIGCASGISWLTATNWAKKLNMILVINESDAVLPSLAYDHEYLNLPTNHIIEIKSDQDSIKKLKKCINNVLVDSFAAVRKIFNEEMKLKNFYVLNFQLVSTLATSNFKKSFSCLQRHVKRNGLRIIFTIEFVKVIWNLQVGLINKILKFLGLKSNNLIEKNK